MQNVGLKQANDERHLQKETQTTLMDDRGTWNSQRVQTGQRFEDPLVLPL